MVYLVEGGQAQEYNIAGVDGCDSVRWSDVDVSAPRIRFAPSTSTPPTVVDIPELVEPPLA